MGGYFFLGGVHVAMQYPGGVLRAPGDGDGGTGDGLITQGPELVYLVAPQSFRKT